MWHVEDDYTGAGDNHLRIQRTYNSSPYNVDAGLQRSWGKRWIQSYDAVIQAETTFTPGTQNLRCWSRTDRAFVWCDYPLPADATVPAAVSVLRGDGKKYFFNLAGTAYVGETDNSDTLAASYASDGTIAGWTYSAANGDRSEKYDALGQLASIMERDGTQIRLTHATGASNDSNVARSPADAPICGHVSAGPLIAAKRLLCVTDNWGRQLQFEYDASGRVTKTIDPAGQETTYTYDGPSGGCTTAGDTSNAACTAGNLTQVTFPDGKSKSYTYNEASQINGGASCPNAVVVGNGFGHLTNTLTRITDENGSRYITWAYDCAGLATSSQVGDGNEKVSLSYGQQDSTGVTTTTVTHYVGNAGSPQTTVNQYSYQMLQGLFRNTGIDGPCLECGNVATRTYDTNANVSTSSVWNGVQTRYSYDTSRNLETSRIEAFGTTQARTTSTAWHANYRLPLKIAEPMSLTTFEYDGSGNLLTKTTQATSDTNGALGFSAPLTGTARKWTYTYNVSGQVLTTTGPRTNVSDVTRYAYDTMGNLVTATNAAGHVTTLSNYDGNGRVGRVVTPNGAIIDLSYTPRGWLSSRAVSVGGAVETTSYDYDGVGQLVGVTLPDSSNIVYTYDDAHRLTAVNDSLNNSIRYTLDLSGNRTAEQVSDNGGTLATQVTRIYSELNRLQQQTGSAR